MKEDLKTYRFNFHATIGEFQLNAANISSPLVATWKRSSQNVSTQTVQMVGGKATFNQTITLQLNMYFEQSKNFFQDKKTLFTFTMNTPKGEKQAGVVYIQVAQMLNNKVDTLSNTYVLEKCPVKDSKVTITIVAQLIGEGAASDTMSIDSSILGQSSGPSRLSIESKKQRPKTQAEPEKIEEDKKSLEEKKSPEREKKSPEREEKGKITQDFQSQIKQLKGQKQKLLKELQKSRNRDDNKEIIGLKAELVKSKSLQEKLQTQISNLRSQNIEHEKELQKMRTRMEQIYELLLSNLNSLY